MNEDTQGIGIRTSLSVLAYDSNKTGSSAQKSHAEACRGGVANASNNQDIRIMLNKDNIYQRNKICYSLLME